jgi:hypothetical protein
MTTVCYHHRADKANICAMFLSYQRFETRWRSLGESNSCFRRERAAFRDGRKQRSFQKPGETPAEAAGHVAFSRSFGASDAVALLRLHQPFAITSAMWAIFCV